MKTDFQGVSGRIQFSGGDRPGNISIVQKFLNETRLVGRYTPGLDNRKGTLELRRGALRWLTPGGTRPSDGNPGTFTTKRILSISKIEPSLVVNEPSDLI